jgi:hypothetical protein
MLQAILNVSIYRRDGTGEYVGLDVMHISAQEAERRAKQSQRERAASRLSVEDAADYCGISTAYLAKLRCVGGGPVFIKAGRRVLYSTDDLDEWLAARRRTSTADAEGAR